MIHSLSICSGWALAQPARRLARATHRRRHPEAFVVIKIFRLGCRLGRPSFDSLIEAQMRYMLLIYDDEKGWAKLSEAEREHYLGEFGKVREEIVGQYVAPSRGPCLDNGPGRDR